MKKVHPTHRRDPVHGHCRKPRTLNVHNLSRRRKWLQRKKGYEYPNKFTLEAADDAMIAAAELRGDDQILRELVEA